MIFGVKLYCHTMNAVRNAYRSKYEGTMKALIKPKNLSHAEAVAVTQKTLEYITAAVTAIVLQELLDRRWHKDTLRTLYHDIVNFFAYPQYFDKWLTDEEIKYYMTKKYNIKWVDSFDISNVLQFAPKRLDKRNELNVTQTAIECCFPAAVSAILFVLQRRGTRWTAKKLQEMYNIILEFDMYDFIEQMQANLTIDLMISWDDLKNAIEVERR